LRGELLLKIKRLPVGIPGANRSGVDNPGQLIADEILAYLVQHPQAQDTMEGIVEWWLLEQKVRLAVADVEAALSNLVDKDFLIARQHNNGRTYYQLNRAKEREIRRHLRKTQAAYGTAPKPPKPKA
jgi:hypothetical protein